MRTEYGTIVTFSIDEVASIVAANLGSYPDMPGESYFDTLEKKAIDWIADNLSRELDQNYYPGAARDLIGYRRWPTFVGEVREGRFDDCELAIKVTLVLTDEDIAWLEEGKRSVREHLRSIGRGG